jgi:chemotaxis protein methyltransferase WspC
MALLDAGVPPSRFQVEGVDISAHNLARAERAVYGSNSFRGQDLAFRDRYFERTREGFELNSVARGCVRFTQGNLLAADFLQGRAAYDYVFCRNLLIYFDRVTQGKTLEAIRSRLAPAGVLFTGAAEQTLTLEHGFVSAKIPMAFACRKAAAQPPRTDRRTRASKPVGWLVTEAPHRSGAVVPAPAGALSSVRAAPGGGSSLDQARRLADAGRLKEAAELCDAHLLKHGASAEAYYLLGLVRDAASDESALDCYRKALYLEPGHYETLLHMALSCQKHGYADRARTFRDRAERVKNRSAGRA